MPPAILPLASPSSQPSSLAFLHHSNQTLHLSARSWYWSTLPIHPVKVCHPLPSPGQTTPQSNSSSQFMPASFSSSSQLYPVSLVCQAVAPQPFAPIRTSQALPSSAQSHPSLPHLCPEPWPQTHASQGRLPSGPWRGPASSASHLLVRGSLILGAVPGFTFRPACTFSFALTQSSLFTTPC